MNGTTFLSVVMLTLCAVEFDAADTDTSDAAAASRRRRDMTETHAPQKLMRGGVEMPYVLILTKKTDQSKLVRGVPFWALSSDLAQLPVAVFL